MQKIFIGVLLCIASLGCAQQKQATNPLQEIIYNARSRGFYFQVTIRKNKISVARENGQAVVEDLPSDVWKELKGMVAGMDLEGMDQLKVPSQERTTDRAAIADVEVVTDHNTYQSTSFDHGKPPKALEALVNKIVQLAETVE